MSSSLTIGIPTINRSTMVERLTKQCLSQTVLPFEVIVSDDHSSDDTFVKLAALSHPRLRILRQSPQLGMVANWNACLNECKSDWFVLLSDDDMIDSNFVESIEQVLKNTQDIDLLIVRCRIEDQVSHQHILNHPPIFHSGKVNFLEDIFPAWCEHLFALPLAGFIFNTRVLRKKGGFSSRLPFAADTDTWIPIAFQGQCAFWHHAIADYVIHKGMTTRTFDVETLLTDSIAIKNLLLEETAKLAISEERRKYLRTLINLHLKRGFGTLMILSARAKAKKKRLLLIWLRYWHQLPGYGISILSVGAILVPEPLIHAVGWPYRQWIKFKRQSLQSPMA